MTKISKLVPLLCAALLLSTTGVLAQSTPAPSTSTAAPAPAPTPKATHTPLATHTPTATTTPAPTASTDGGGG